MSMSKQGRNSNLFYIDRTKIEPTLEDANQPLIDACEKMLGNVDQSARCKFFVRPITYVGLIFSFCLTI